MVYDPLGRVDTVTTYDDPTAGTAKTQTQRTYDDWGNVLTYEQDPDSAIGASGRASFETAYTYEEEESSGAGGRNTVRRTGMVYPGPMALVYQYLSSGNLLDDDSSRVTRIAVTDGDVTTPIVEYDYLGVGRLVGTDLLEPEVRWELFEGRTGGDEYPNFDRFTRVEGCQWERYGKGGGDK